MNHFLYSSKSKITLTLTNFSRTTDSIAKGNRVFIHRKQKRLADWENNAAFGIKLSDLESQTMKCFLYYPNQKQH